MISNQLFDRETMLMIAEAMRRNCEPKLTMQYVSQFCSDTDHMLFEIPNHLKHLHNCYYEQKAILSDMKDKVIQQQRRVEITYKMFRHFVESYYPRGPMEPQNPVIVSDWKVVDRNDD